MPLYDYRCTACGRETEVMHSIHDQGPETCAACGGTMSKVLSPPAIHFKGSGWAKKDAASKAKPKASTPAAGKEAAGGERSSATAKPDKAATASTGAGDKGSPPAQGD
jgi:putative FmdB family regulatory protein